MLEILKKAIERTRNEFGCNGNHDSDLIENALSKLLSNIIEEEEREKQIHSRNRDFINAR